MHQATELYHRAVWALDAANARVEQYWLMKRWEHVTRMLALEDGDADAIASEVRMLVNVSEAAISKHESDQGRSLPQKQRDYLLGVVARCTRAARLKFPTSAPDGWKDRFFRLFRRSSLASALTPQQASYLADIVLTLHYYSPDAESFHADLGVGYYLWQGLRAELKMGLTLAHLSGEEPRKVTEVAEVMRNILEAMEHGKHELLVHYEKSALQLSDEQYQQRLWEGVVSEMTHLLRNSGRADMQRYLA